MGFLDRLFGKKAPEFTERIWLTTGQKINDLMAQVRRCQALGVYPLAVAHFPATQRRLLEAFGKSGIAAHQISSPSQFPIDLPDRWSAGAAIAVLSSEAIPSSFQLPPAAAQQGAGRLAPVSVHLAEHYPSPGRDQGVLALAKIWPRSFEFTWYTALDEPWLVPFGIEKTRQIIAKLGMDEATVLSHPVLHNAILGAQEQIARRVPHEQRCDSCEEWMQCNFPRTSSVASKE